MREHTQARHFISLVCICVIAAECFALTDLLCIGTDVRADTSITLSAVCNNDDVTPGDIVKVDVIADTMPSIVSFGPVVLGYDTGMAEYISTEQGTSFSGFAFTEDQGDGSVIISAEDHMAASGSSSDDSSDDSETKAFSSDEPVILFTVSLRILPNASGEINIWLDDLGEFRNSNNEGAELNKGSGVTIPINEAMISDDASLAFLKIRGVQLTPEFEPNITSYSATVERSVSEVTINATANNLWAAVIIDGNQNLKVGDNEITIDVTAQDGVNHMHYSIHITRNESYVPENAVLADGEGNTYTFLDIPEKVNVPEGFTQTTKVVNGYSVPAYTREGVSSILLYLFDGTNDPGLYFYNSQTKTVIKYNPDNTIIRTSKILQIAELPHDVSIPTGFVAANYDTGNAVFTGYVNKDKDFICYLVDETGGGDFYLYNAADGSFQVYKPADKRAEVLYSYLFNVFLIISIVESIIIVIIVYLVRRIFVDKTHPRPKRV